MGKKILWGVIGLVVLGAILGKVGSSSDSSSSGGSSGGVEAAAIGTAVTGKVVGHFKHDCFLCEGNLDRYIDVSDVWCAWQDGKVIVHITATNNSVEHITLDWHPSYTIAGGGEHGAGMTSIQSDGFDAGQTRDLAAEQEPDGVEPDSPIGTCKPSFNNVESG